MICARAAFDEPYPPQRSYASKAASETRLTIPAVKAVALEHGVGHALAIEIGGECLLFVESAGQRPLLEHRRLVVVPDRVHGLGDLEIQLSCRVLDRRVDRQHLGVLVAVAFREQRLAPFELGKLGLQ